MGASGLVIRIYSETIHFYNYYHSPVVFSKKVSFYCFFLLSLSILTDDYSMLLFFFSLESLSSLCVILLFLFN